MTINLTKPMREWVAEQAEARGFKDEEAYVQQLIKEDKNRQAVEQLMKDMKEADESGVVEATEELWEQSIERVKAHFRNPMKKGDTQA